jgi:TolA-binding protein
LRFKTNRRMSTYKKVKTQKTNTNTQGAESTTKEVFEALNVTASRSEQWIEKNQKPLLIAFAIVAVVILGYLGYTKYIQEPKEVEASNELAFPKQYFEAALDGRTLDTQVQERDSLLVLGLEGADGKYGFLDIADTYSGTKAGNLAEYYAGISYLKMKDYKNAVTHLGNFSSDDELLAPSAIAAIGDAFAEINQLDDAYDYYVKAANAKENEFTTPLFLFKAGQTALNLGKNKKALEFFKRIEKDYSTSDAAKEIDYYINKATYTVK